MNLFTKEMKLLTAVVLEQKTDQVVKTLLSLGVLDFVHVNKLNPDQMKKLSSRPSSISRSSLEEMRLRVEAMLKQGHVLIPSAEKLDVSELQTPQMQTYRSTLDELTGKLLALKEKQKQSNQQAMGLEEMRRYMHEDKGEYLDLRVGEIGHGKVEDLSGKLSAFGGLLEPIGSNNKYISLTLKRDISQVDPLLQKYGWLESGDIALQKEAFLVIRKRLEKEHENIVSQRKSIEASVDELVRSRQNDLFAIWANLRLNELSDQIRSYFSYTRNTTLFSGWVPADQADQVFQAIMQASDGQCVVDWTEAKQLPRNEIPVAVTSPKLLAPFQKMVTNYSIPEYGTVNPTFFVMAAYLAMFGLMFADVGQGLALFVIGLLFRQSYKKHPLRKDGLISRNLSDLLLYLGISAMVFGALFGSYFGLELLPPLWFNYEAAVGGHAQNALVSDVYGILGITIKFGIVIIFTGLILNWINLVRKRDYLTLALDKNGLLGGLLFALGLYLGFGFVQSGYRSFPSQPWISTVITVSLILLFCRGFLKYYVHRRKGGEALAVSHVILDAVMEWLVDILEIFTGYLSNTLSFMRVAGLGIAHASLMISFKQLSDMVGGFGGLTIFILGNILVIVLEGLSAGIQSLRLNYYEFFSRYFTGRGIAYEPVRLSSSSFEKR